MNTTIENILGLPTVEEVIEALKVKIFNVPSWDTLRKEFYPEEHAINNKAIYPDKKIFDENDQWIRDEPRTRVMLGLQKLATSRMTEFLFTIPPNQSCEEADTDDTKAEQLKIFKKILKKVKWGTLNKTRARAISSECEQATLWYLVKQKKPTKKYGFPSDYKLKYSTFSPSKGDLLFPRMDETGDMIAFSRQFVVKTEAKSTTYFETWTDKKHIRWVQLDSSGWTEDINEDIFKLDKIPVVYGYRPVAIWQDADHNKIHEMELLLSRSGEIIAYHSAPVLLLSGDLKGAPIKDESNKVFATENGGDAKYVSWDQSPETVSFLFEKLWKSWFTELQLPDLSFENIKGMGALSGEARKWLMADAHLKVGDECEIYDDIIDRDFSIIKSYMGIMNPAWADSLEELDIENTIIPFIIDDEAGRVEVLIAANGGKPIISQERSVELANFSNDPKSEFIKIEGEYLKEKELDKTETDKFV